ncbi:MAG: hypothetical protein N2578_05095 [Bdellovibrionaceae bacterium]|nr:hypothetical protein [Pseudobdellovibrionaceae bacterium]
MLLLLLVTGLAVLYFSWGVLRYDLALNNSCREIFYSTQSKVGANLTKLLKLNQKAVSLRRAEQLAEASLALAMSSGNPAAISAAKISLNSVRTMRRTLDIHQRYLIDGSNLTLLRGYNQAIRNLRSLHNKLGAPLKPWFLISLGDFSGKAPHLAVRPKQNGPAPEYETLPNFREKQALVLNWQWAIRYRDNHLLPSFDSLTRRGCRISLRKDGDKWAPVAEGDRRSLNFLP